MGNMLRVLIDKVDKMQEQVGNVKREIEILKKVQGGGEKEKLHMKKSNRCINAFDRLVSSHNVNFVLE